MKIKLLNIYILNGYKNIAVCGIKKSLYQMEAQCRTDNIRFRVVKTEPAFDYIDDISRNVLYLKIHDVLIICALDSFNFFNLQYQEEVHILDSLEIVHPLQGLELFAKMVYYKTHYKFDTEHKVIIDASGPYIENKIINATQIRPFNLKELYDLMKNVLQLRGVTDEIPEYVEGKMFSFIPRKV